jgi:hypothetical protein
MQRITTRVIEYLGQEPVSLAEAKEYLRAYHTGDDTYIGSLIGMVRSHCERWMGVSLMEKKIHTRVINANKNFELTYWPVDEILEATPEGITHTDGVLNNATGENIDITYTTGVEFLPEIKQAILNLISHWYNNRDMAETPQAVADILNANKRNLWFS